MYFLLALAIYGLNVHSTTSCSSFSFLRSSLASFYNLTFNCQRSYLVKLLGLLTEGIWDDLSSWWSEATFTRAPLPNSLV